jgi:RTX calcium-binding nonapeptide repeat (4 copies)
MSTHLDPPLRRALALAAAAGACLVATLGITTSQASAAYSARVQAGTLLLSGDASSDALVLQPAPPNTLVVSLNGAPFASFDRSSFSAVDVQAGGGDDEVSVQNGDLGLQGITLNGGSGDDRLIGGSTAEVLIGGAGNDFVDGNIGADSADLGAGADTFQWDPGDGSDTVEGQGGNDSLQFNGSNAAEHIDVSANGPRVRLTRNVGAIDMDLDGIERLNLRALAGSDTITTNDLAGTDLKSADVDLTAVSGDGDGSPDTVVANGTGDADDVDVSSTADAIFVSGLSPQIRVSGSEPALDDVKVATLGGADTIDSGVQLAGPAPVSVDGGDGSDTATYKGTGADDTIGIARNGAAVATFTPTSGPLNVAAVENLDVRGLGGADAITASNGIGTLTQLTLDGAAGDDTLRGGDGNDVLLAGSGDDLVDGNIGADSAELGGGADTFQWDPGDGSDSVEGQGGSDVLAFNGSNAAEQIDVSANGPRVRLTRNVGAITMDVDGIERLALRALAGSDTITVDDLAGTDLKAANVDLAASTGDGDGSADTVIANGGSRAEKVQVTRSGSQVLTTGLAAQTTIAGSEAANDTLRVNTLGGRDTVTVSADVNALITPVVDLGADQ